MCVDSECNIIFVSVRLSFLFQNEGRLRFSKQSIVYKSIKTGKVDTISAPDLSLAQWRRVCLGHGIKLTTSTGHVYKYDGFKDSVSVLKFKDVTSVNFTILHFICLCFN